jgi:hypothetical protein
MEATGFPGIPKKIFSSSSPHVPNATGLPGFIETFQK